MTIEVMSGEHGCNFCEENAKAVYEVSGDGISVRFCLHRWIHRKIEMSKAMSNTGGRPGEGSPNSRAVEVLISNSRERSLFNEEIDDGRE